MGEPEASSESDTAEYKPVWIVSEREGKDGRKDIYFQVCQPNSVTPDQTALHSEIEKTLTAFHVLFSREKDTARYGEVVQKLLMLAQLGLVGVRGECNPSIARDALIRLQAEVAEIDGPKVKNDFLKKLGIAALMLSIPASATAIYLFVENSESAYSFPLFNLCCLWIATQAGTWLSFASRKLDIGFFDLSRISEDQLEPSIRLLFTGAFSVLFSLTLWAGLLSVQVGAFQADAWIASPLTATVLGALSGIAEKALPSNVTGKAEQMLSAHR